MFEHRRKIALAVALILALGSAAASAANYAGGRGVMPSAEGASEALELALSGTAKASDWMISRSRKVISSAFSYQPPAPVRPPEVPYLPQDLPSYQRGSGQQSDIGPQLPYSRVDNNGFDGTPPSSFDGLSSAHRADLLASSLPSPVATSLSSLPGGGVAPVPELPPFTMLLAGLALMAPVILRRGKPSSSV